jgi:uncharacterized protein (DUF1810 family)
LIKPLLSFVVFRLVYSRAVVYPAVVDSQREGENRNACMQAVVVGGGGGEGGKSYQAVQVSHTAAAAAAEEEEE